MKVLVTGSNGQVGYCLVQQLRQQNADFLALDRDQLDITQCQAVWQTVSDYRPDVIINAAAHTAVDKAESEAEQAFAINRDGAAYLAEAAQQISAAMLHISTDYVFDGQVSRNPTPKPIPPRHKVFMGKANWQANKRCWRLVHAVSSCVRHGCLANMGIIL